MAADLNLFACFELDCFNYKTEENQIPSSMKLKLIRFDSFYSLFSCFRIECDAVFSHTSLLTHFFFGEKRKRKRRERNEDIFISFIKYSTWDHFFYSVSLLFFISSSWCTRILQEFLRFLRQLYQKIAKPHFDHYLDF